MRTRPAMSQPDDSTKLHDLQKVLQISRSMVATTDLDSLLHVIIERSMELLGAERATLFLYDAASDQLVSRIAHKSEEIRMPADKGIAGACIQTRSVINVPDAYADERHNPEFDRRSGFRTRNLLAVPLCDYAGDLVGVLEVMNKKSGSFRDYDIDLAETLAAQAGVAIQRANLIRHYVEKQKMQRALEIARDIQRGLLPKAMPVIPGFDLAAFSQPADETGGDIFDFLPMDDQRLGIMVADATGHGIGPALVIAETRAMLRALSGQAADVSAMLATVNDLLAADLGDGRFVTCFLGVLDAARSRLSFASAGHGPMLLYDRQADQFTQQVATAIPLGTFDGVAFDRTVNWDLHPGDVAAIFTDGLFEAMDANQEQFGIERVMDLLRCCCDMPAREMLETLRMTVMSHTGVLPQADDITAVVIRRT
jgi:sigma-B regulation protein RsbU (phosphoserine phosphatase)